MFKNLHIKIFSLMLALLFWVFVVSFESTFVQFPEEVPIKIFNQAAGLAVASRLGSAKLTVRVQDRVVLRALSSADFEAYIDLQNVGAGKSKVPVSVSSKNPQVSVVRVFPSEVEVELETVRQKVISVVPEVKGEPARGFRVDGVKLLNDKIRVSGAESILKKIAGAKARFVLKGDENQSFERAGSVYVYDRDGALMEGLEIEDAEIPVFVSISEQEHSKQVGIKARLAGVVANGVVKRIEVKPAVVSVSGARDVLDKLEFVETESVDLKEFAAAAEKKAKLALPQGVKLAPGEAGEVVVKVEIEKQ